MSTSSKIPARPSNDAFAIAVAVLRRRADMIRSAKGFRTMETAIRTLKDISVQMRNGYSEKFMATPALRRGTAGREEFKLALAMAQALLSREIATYETLDPNTTWNDPAGSLEALASALLGEIARAEPMQAAA